MRIMMIRMMMSTTTMITMMLTITTLNVFLVSSPKV